MTRDDGTHQDGEQPGDKEKKPKGRSSFVPRWRQNQTDPLTTPAVEEPPKKPAKFQARWRQNTVEPVAETPPPSAPAPAPEPQAQAKPEKKKFQARWRQNTVEPEIQASTEAEHVTRIHPNLQQQPAPESGAKGFQPRWRQRALEIAAKEEEARAQAPPAPENQGFQPRWRRTAASGPLPTAQDAPLPGSDAPLEGGAAKSKDFKPSWRERAEREPVAAPPKAEFTPRWKRTMATEPPPVEVPPAPAEPPSEIVAEVIPEAPQMEPVTVELGGVAEDCGQELTGAPAATTPMEAPLSLIDSAPLAEAAPALAAPDPTPLADPPIALAATVPTALATPLATPLGAPIVEIEEVEEPTVELVAEAPVEVVAPPPQPEKRRLPRPQPPPPPKTPAPAPPQPPDEAVPVAEPTTETAPLEPEAPQTVPVQVMEVAAARPIVPVPNTEGDDYQPGPSDPVPSFLPGPDLFEAKVEKARAERSNLVETELVEAPRKPKRLDDEAIAALKATANLVTRGAPIAAATPAPPPPPPPPPAQAPRYTPTPRAPSSGSIAVAGLKESPASVRTEPQKKLYFGRGKPKPASLEDVATFTRQFSVMISAGLPIHQALSFFAESSTGPLAEVMDDVATKISSGHRLSQAMSRHQTVFSEVYVGLIELGETSSHIDEALEKLAELLEKQVRLGKRLSSALVYPAFLVAVSLASIGVFLQYVLPTMIPLFASFNMELPLPTRMLLGSRHLVIPCAILAVLSVIFWQWFRPHLQLARRNKEKWAYDADKAMMKIPLIGKFFHQMAVARVLFALATMIETGLPILNALKRCETVASNLAFAERLEKAGAELRDGATVTDALSLYEVLPPSCLHLISAGEESAQMAEMVQYAARFYEEEVEHSIDTFMSLVEPIIMVFMGFVVGFIVLSAVLPTVQMINHLGG
ncbi:type II secretion system F family protein [bacterium]|nr:type II secretion system F family protein [bacterium]